MRGMSPTADRPRKITIENHPSTNVDGRGELTVGWTEAGTAWGIPRTLSGREREIAHKNHSEATHEVEFMADSSIVDEHNCRFRIGDQILYPVFIERKNFQSVKLFALCKESVEESGVALLNGLYHWWDFTSPTDISDKVSDRSGVAGAAIDFTQVGTLLGAFGAPHGGTWLDFTSSGSNYLNGGSVASNTSGSGFGFEHSQSDFTFSTVFMLNSDDGSADHHLFSWRASAAGTLNFHVFVDEPDTDLMVRTWDDAGSLLEVEDTRILKDQTYHVVFTHENATGLGTLYINQTEAATATQLLGDPDPNNRTIRVGQKSWNTDGNFDGKIGPTGFWNRVLDRDERAWLYNGGSGRLYQDLS